MRLTIVAADNMVLIDNRAISIPELSTLLDEPKIHAVQWYEDHGEIEWKGVNDEVERNEPIDSMTSFQNIVDRWNELKAIEDTPEPETPTTPVEEALILTGFTTNTLVRAVYLSVAESDHTMVNSVSAELKDAATQVGVDYIDIVEALTES